MKVFSKINGLQLVNLLVYGNKFLFFGNGAKVFMVKIWVTIVQSVMIFVIVVSKGTKTIPATGMRKKTNKSAPTAKTELRLKLELVPKPLWNKNLRSENALGKNGWIKLRKTLLEERGLSGCEICGIKTDRLHAHEVWNYEEGKKVSVATIIGINFICSFCHDIHHFGRMRALYRQGVIEKDRMLKLVKHFMRVNECTENDFDMHQDQTALDWGRRNGQKWVIDYGVYVSAGKDMKQKKAR